jgi:hypothetical protein
MIVKGSAEFANLPKTFSSQGSKPYMRTRQHPPRMPRRRLSATSAPATYLRNPVADADARSKGRSTSRPEADAAKSGDQA